jgi:hypothetical protein
VDSCEGAADGGEDGDSVVARGAWAGGCRECVVVLEEVPVCAPDRFTLLAEVALVLPGKAFAAISAKAPVRTTLPAISQRLIL